MNDNLAVEEHYYYTFEEYLTLEEQAETKSEYHRGEIVSMAGASLSHNEIAGNIHGLLYNALAGKPCRAYISDLRLWIEARQRATYPDVTVVCGKAELLKGRADTIVNPTIIIEVLSRSTERLDRGAKFHAYWRLDSLKEYVLVDQYQVRVEYFRRRACPEQSRRDEKTWELRVYTKLDETLTLQSLEVDLSLNEIYRNVELEE